MTPRKLPLLGILLFLSLTAFSTSYYIDYSAGSDSNAGTSQSAPWQHAPGMTGCAGNCASANPVAGDRVILKGGVTWPSGTLPWNFKWAGSASSDVYLGVDKTWYAGSAWSRPVLDAGKQLAGSNNLLLDVESSSHLTVDNLEFTGLYWNASVEGFHQSHYLQLSQADYITIENCYFHGWSHDTFANGATDNMIVILGDSHFPNQAPHSSIHDSVIDGGDTDRISGAAIYGGPPNIYNNVIRNMSNGIISNGTMLVHDNLIENIARSYDPGVHLNGFESNCDDGLLFYNNVVRHTDLVLSGSQSKAGIVVWFAPGGGNTSYAFNNIIYDGPTTQANTFLVSPGSQSCPGGGAGFLVAYNNTVACGPAGQESGVCSNNVPSSVPTTFSNMLWITSNANAYTGAVTATTNLKESPTQAANLGLTANQTLAYLPPASAVGTLSSGTNLTGSCSASLSALCKDTTFACSADSSNQVQCPQRAAAFRPASGAWMVGAYALGGGSSSAPAPPTGLTVVVQ